jgi:hypothetical protein
MGMAEPVLLPVATSILVSAARRAPVEAGRIFLKNERRRACMVRVRCAGMVLPHKSSVGGLN